MRSRTIEGLLLTVFVTIYVLLVIWTATVHVGVAILTSIVGAAALTLIGPEWARFLSDIVMGVEESPDPDDDAPDLSDDRPEIGSEGRARTALRPAGQIEVENQVYEAEADRAFIDANSPVTILAWRGRVAIVEQRFPVDSAV